jgi:hypothetical protein
MIWEGALKHCITLACLLLASCGSGRLGLNRIEDFVNDRAPIQVWSGTVTFGGAPVSGAAVVVTSVPIVDPQRDGESAADFAARGAAAEALRIDSPGTTDAAGVYAIFFRWYKDRVYTLTAVDPSNPTHVWSSGAAHTVRWQDQTTDIPLDAPVPAT